jgi:dTDP-4-dehydrorhamnose 3,5-epimerase-like enzyme
LIFQFFLYSFFVNKYEIISFSEFVDERGSLVPFEFDELPFIPQRIYLVTATEGSIRGGHAHIIEEEIFLVTNGSATLLVNDGNNDKEIILDSRKKGVLVRTGCWHELKNFSADAVVLALSSTKYLPGAGNYVTDKEKFLLS